MAHFTGLCGPQARHGSRRGAGAPQASRNDARGPHKPASGGAYRLSGCVRPLVRWPIRPNWGIALRDLPDRRDDLLP